MSLNSFVEYQQLNGEKSKTTSRTTSCFLRTFLYVRRGSRKLWVWKFNEEEANGGTVELP